MATAADLIEETRALLESGTRPELNRLNGALTDDATTATLEFDMGSIQTGAVLAVDLELIYVWSISGQVATVQRGYLGTTPAVHDDDSLVYVNPRWSAFTILRAINAELDSYSSPKWGLYRMRTADVTYSSGRIRYSPHFGEE